MYTLLAQSSYSNVGEFGTGGNSGRSVLIEFCSLYLRDSIYGLQLEGPSMSFLCVSYRAQLSAATSSLVSFCRNDLLKLARNNYYSDP